MSKFEVKELTKVFGKNTIKALALLDKKASKAEILKQTGATVGVNRVSFNVEEGEIFVIMGLSGSGKSTLIRLLNQLIEPTSGAMLLDGENLATMTKKELIDVRRRKMSMVFQNFGLFPNRSIQKKCRIRSRNSRCRQNRTLQVSRRSLENSRIRRIW